MQEKESIKTLEVLLKGKEWAQPETNWTLN